MNGYDLRHGNVRQFLYRGPSTEKIAQSKAPKVARYPHQRWVNAAANKHLTFRPARPDKISMGDKGQRTAMRVTALALAFAALAIGLLTPIYTDEIAWRLLGRWWIDGVDRGLSVTCVSGFFANPPPFMWPIRAFSGLTAQTWPHPLSVRLAGIACFAIWLAVLWRIIGTVMPAKDVDRFRLIALSVMSLGLLPFAMAMSRPEQPLLLALSACVLVMVSSARLGGRRATVAALCSILIFTAVALSYHPKGTVYSPLFLLAVPFAGAARMPLLRSLAFLAILVMIGSAFAYWRSRLACPEDPIMTAYFAQENLLSRLFGGEAPGQLLPELLRNASPGTYVLKITARFVHTSDWLPRGMVDYSFLPWMIAIGLVWFILIGSALATVVIFAAKRGLAAFSDRRFLIAALSLAIVIGWSALQPNKNPYESALALPMFVLAFCLALSLPLNLRDTRLWDQLWNAAAGLFAILAIGSLIWLGFYYVPTMVQRSGPGYVPQQIHSTSIFNYPKAKQWVAEASRRCEIPTDGSAGGVLVDDLTYFSFLSSPGLYYRTGFFRKWRGTLDDPSTYLLAHHSVGIVHRCDDMPIGIRRHAISVGPVCCLNREMLTRAARDPERRLKPFENLD